MDAGLWETKKKGFTLIEVLITMAIVSISMAAVVAAFNVQQKTQVTQELIAEMQQNVRAAIYHMERNIRMAGYDPAINDGLNNDGDAEIDEADETSGAGFQAARPFNCRFTTDLTGGESDGLDNDGDGTTDEADEAAFGDMDTGDANESYNFGFTSGNDSNGDGIANGGAKPLRDNLAENIHAIGFAYAYDNDGDEVLDFYDANLNGTQDANENIIWAVDTDGDNLLETHLDTDNNGAINTNDAEGGQLLAAVGQPTNIPLTSIRAVKIWLLARTRAPVQRKTRAQTFVVGINHISVPSDSYERRLMELTVKCRNLYF